MKTKTKKTTTQKSMPPVRLSRIEMKFVVIDTDIGDLIAGLYLNGAPRRLLAAVEQARVRLRKAVWAMPEWALKLHTPPLPPASLDD